MTDYIGGKPITWIKPQEKNGGIPVNPQDQTTPPVDAYFTESISTFSLDGDTPVSTLTVIELTFDVVAGHGIAPGDEILLLNEPNNKSLFAVVKTVAVNTITIDRPIDSAYPSGANGRIVNTEMAVDATPAAPRLFTVRAGDIPIDATRMIVSMICASTPDDSKFGDLSALTNGMYFRIVNGFQKTVFNFRTNGEIKNFCYDLTYSDKAGGGNHGVSARISYAGPSKHGVAMRVVGPDDALQWGIQDGLKTPTALLSLKISLQGHEISN